MALHRGLHHSRELMKPRLRSLLFLLCALALALSFPPASRAKETAAVAKHIILVIGDGMEPENEVAAGRYLTGTDDGLSFHAFPYRGWVATWDVTTYSRQAPYNPSSINPKAGCDATRTGKAASRSATPRYACRAPGGARPHGADSASTATAWATGYKTDTGNIAWLPGDPERGALETIAELLRRVCPYCTRPRRRCKRTGVLGRISPWGQVVDEACPSANKTGYLPTVKWRAAQRSLAVLAHPRTAK